MTEPVLDFPVMHIASGDLWAGAEVQVHTLVRELARAAPGALHVVVLNPGELAERLAGDGIGITLLDERRMQAGTLLAHTLRAARRHGARIIHSHRQKENVLAALTALALPGCRSLRTSHGAPEHPLKWWQLHKQAPRLLDRAAGRWGQQRVVAVSAELGERLAAHYPRERIAIIENGIDSAAVRAAAQTTADLPRRPGVTRVVAVGRLVPVKRFDRFIECARQVLAEAGAAVEFVIYGDGPLRSQLERQAADLPGVQLPGFRANLPAHLRQADLLLITSDHEGLPMTLLEALALALPVAVHAVGGMPAVLEGGRYGVLVREPRPEAFAAVVRALLAEPALFRARAAAAAAHLEQRYGARACAQNYLALYRELAADHRRR